MSIINNKIKISGFSTTNSPTLLVGNVIPNDWYQKFTNNRGSPDLTLISVLAEIVYWYRPKKIKDATTGVTTYVKKFLGDAWQTSYQHFENKFSFNREKIRRIFIKLEQLGICKREFRNIEHRGQIYNNRLFIHLAPEFLNSKCILYKKTNTDQQSSENGQFSIFRNEGASPHFVRDYIIDNKNNINIENRSIKSNFLKNNLVNETQESFKLKELKDFYPLSQQDCEILQSKSGRKFNLRAMNEILFDMSKRLCDRYFKSKNAFLSYMGKVFTSEKRDPIKINNETFKIKNNYTVDEINIKKQEEFLTKIENSLEVSPEIHLKKKLVSVLEPFKSYELLKAYKSVGYENSIFKIYLSTHVSLKDFEKEIILNQVKATHNNIDQNKIFDQLQIIMPEELPTLKTNKNNYENKQSLPQTIWGEIRQALILSFYKDGENLDKYWFSKLEAEINEDNRIIKLKAQTNFIKDWIIANYLSMIEKISAQNNYQVVIL